MILTPLAGGHMRRGAFLDEMCIVADNRKIRPQGHAPDAAADELLSEYEPKCVFCPGNEAETPSAIYAFPPRHANNKDQKGWTIRVVPNLYAAQTIEGSTQELPVGPYLLIGSKELGARGAHEVLIESDKHNLELSQQPIEHLELILITCRDRLDDLYQDKKIKQVTIFRNKGKKAGSSLPHPHSQIIGTPIIPPSERHVLDAARHYFAQQKRCRWCDDLRFHMLTGVELAETSGGDITYRFPKNTFVVEENDDFIAFAPFVAQCLWQIEILPKKHSHDFRLATDDVLASLGQILKQIIICLQGNIYDLQYNMILRTAPNYEPEQQSGRADKWGTLSRDFHWGVSIQPITNILAGFEKASGITILTMAPETWAANLRRFSSNR